jgi:hypothetical protein
MHDALSSHASTHIAQDFCRPAQRIRLYVEDISTLRIAEISLLIGEKCIDINVGTLGRHPWSPVRGE